MHRSLKPVGILSAFTLMILTLAHSARAEFVATQFEDSNAGYLAPFGSTGDPSNNYNPPGREFQELYSHTIFNSVTAAPFSINQLAFASADLGQNASNFATYNVTLSLSTTQALANYVSTDFSLNEGPDFTTVFTGQLTADLKNNGTYDLIFPTKSFLYDPTKGDLLLDVVINQTTQSQSLNAFRGADFRQASTVSYVPQLGRVAIGEADVATRFNVEPTTVPEPSTPLAFAIGTLGVLLLFAVGRKRFTIGH